MSRYFDIRRMIFDINSFEIIGIQSSSIDDEKNISRPVLIKGYRIDEEEKLLHFEYESNPFNSQLDYRIKAFSQSLLINYHAVILFTLFFSYSKIFPFV